MTCAKNRASVGVLRTAPSGGQEANRSPAEFVIRRSPIDLHLKGFEALGAAVRVEAAT